MVMFTKKVHAVFFYLLFLVFQSCLREDVESLAYTIREVNAVVGLNVYTAAVVCSPVKLTGVQEV